MLSTRGRVIGTYRNTQGCPRWSRHLQYKCLDCLGQLTSPRSGPIQQLVEERNRQHRTPTDSGVSEAGAVTGGKGQFTQWVHCEFVVGFETIRLAHTQQVSSEHFQKVPTNSPNPNPAGHF